MQNKIFHNNYLVIGGDLRQEYMAEGLTTSENKVFMVFGNQDSHISKDIIYDSTLEDAIAQCDVIIFPLPISKDEENINCGYEIKILDILKQIPEDKIVLAGGVTSKVQECFDSRNIKVYDYFKEEELAIFNAIPTAEGAIEIAMRELPTTIFESNCLITGYGRISKVLAKDLHGMGCNVSVLARKKGDLAYARAYGYGVYDMEDIAHAVRSKDIIFNTVPHPIINSAVLPFVDKKCLIIDLASSPGGVDFAQAENLDIKTIWALALPGKVAPKTAGLIIKDTIFNIIKSLPQFKITNHITTNT